MNVLFKRTKEALSSAREHYGFKNQILVSVEELTELSCVLTKYPRYETHEAAVRELRDHVIEECGDVFNALDHIQAIFDITDDEIIEAAGKKGDRLMRWLATEGMEVTTQDRDVPTNPCPLCLYNGADPFSMPCYVCHTQPGYKGFTPRKADRPDSK